ncbi:MAG: hypothetical protein MZV70_38735 [Desulfobacterales bacterium]|nr:hypothetical protein [Desulfobacterales bacterium]
MSALDGDSLLGARIVDALSDIFFHPHSRAAGAAAEALVEISFHFDNIDAGNSLQNLTRLIINLDCNGPGSRNRDRRMCPRAAWVSLILPSAIRFGDDFRVMINFDNCRRNWGNLSSMQL